MTEIESSGEFHQSHVESQRHGTWLVVYFVLTFVVTWSCWALAAYLRGSPALSQAIFLIGVFTPGILAVAFTLRVEGEAGVRAILGRIAKWNVSWRFYAFAIAFMPFLKLVAAALHRALTGSWPRFGDTPIVLMLAALLVSTWVQAGEEIGWRGYALPRMSRRLGLGAASVLLGLIWASWHLPLFFYPNSDMRGQSFALYFAQVMAISVVIGWLYWRTGRSLLVVMLFHAAVNNLKDIVPSAIKSPADSYFAGASLLGLISLSLLWISAAFFLYQMRGVALIDDAR
jgi:membrane protease YdiL (CAAX protease family)